MERTNNKYVSFIRKTFNDDLLKLLASVCDTSRITRVSDKIDIAHKLLKRYNVRFESLGGATNRLVVFINGYCVKFALDRQGYRDNLIEYSLSYELQPYVPKSFETNGYILICKAVRTMTIEEWRMRINDIKSILRKLATDYLLGDVGYIEKNFTNWGVDDNGNCVILDYAYIHRATENLFRCDVCGEGTLVYDESFSYLRCNNATVCDTTYDYIERKVIQGYQVDIDMINDMKEDSVVIHKGEIVKSYSDEYETKDMSILEGKKVIRIDNWEEYYKFIEEANKMSIYKGYDESSAEAMEIIVKALNESDLEKKEEILEELDEVFDDPNEVKEEVILDMPAEMVQAIEEKLNEKDGDKELEEEQSDEEEIVDELDEETTEEVEEEPEVVEVPVEKKEEEKTVSTNFKNNKNRNNKNNRNKNKNKNNKNNKKGYSLDEICNMLSANGEDITKVEPEDPNGILYNVVDETDDSFTKDGELYAKYDEDGNYTLEYIMLLNERNECAR